MDTEYEKQIKQGRDRLEVIASAAFTVNSAVQVIATTLIQEHAPSEVEAGAADIVEAGSHARSTCRTLADLAEQAQEGAKALSAIGKEIKNIEWAARRLFADLLARADAEEARRREEERERQEREENRQEGLPFEEPTSSPGLVEQTAAAALPVWLAMARDLAREDAPKGIRSSDAESLAITLELPPELTPHTAVVFAAYGETWEATEPKKKRKK